MAERPIASEAATVSRLFELLKSLTPSTEGSTSGNSLTEVDDQFGRFRIFAMNVGVFAAGHASLDYRLRQSDDAQNVTLTILRSLQWFLRRAIQASGLPEGQSQSSQMLLSLTVTTDDAHSSTVDTFPSSEASAPSTNFTQDPSEAGGEIEHLSGIEGTIDRLYRLSWQIRTNSVSQHSRAARFRMIDEDGKECEGAFKHYVAEVVKHRCPDASPELVEIMARSILERRKRFLYRKSHQAKLSVKESEVQPTGGTVRSSRTLPSVMEDGQDTESKVHQAQPRSMGKANVVAPSATSASVFSRSKFRSSAVFDAKSVLSTAVQSPNDGAEAFEPPPPPKVPLGRKEFECQYCCIMIPIKEARPTQWRQHFLKDLEPFVCLHPACEKADHLFDNLRGWLQHMESEHVWQWCCSAPSHAKEYFSCADDFLNHLRSMHTGAFAEHHLPMLEKRARVPGNAFTSCPFCKFPESAGLESSSSNESLELVKHIANHLRSLAMISLPIDDNVEDGVSQATASRQANESAEGKEGDLLDGLASLSSASDEPLRQDLANISLVFEDVHPDEGISTSALQNEWGFIEPIPYPGHDRDPKLQTFLRKWYLQSSPSMLDMKGPNLPCWLIPFARNPDFFGREYALMQAAGALVSSVAASISPLSEAVSNPKTYAICGPGGMGKTQLAVEFVYRYKEQFDTILWAHADDASKLMQDFSAMALKLGLVAEDSADSRDQRYSRELVKRWLVDPLKNLDDKDTATADRASWLLVFDAVEDSRILNEFWPYDGPGSILVTSRNPFAWTTSLPLVPFTVEEATEYLLKLTKRDRDSESNVEVHDVTEKLGGLPLALTQMAGIITRQELTFAEFAQAYNDRESRSQMLQTAPVPSLSAPWYEHSVASVWALENLRHGMTLLNVCSMFDSDGIIESIFTENLGKIDLSGFPNTFGEYKQAKVELLGSSIISGEKASGKLFIHRLVQDVALMRMSSVQFRKTFMACVQLISNLWPFENFTWRHGVERWPACEQLFPHVRRLQELVGQNQHFPSADDFEGDFAFARLLTDAGWYHHERGRSAEARWFDNIAEQTCISWLDRLSTANQDQEIVDDRARRLRETLAEITHNRGCIVLETNQPALALSYLNEFNAQMTKEFDSTPELINNDMRLAISWNELGNAYMLNKQWRRGEQCFERSIETMQLQSRFDPSIVSLPMVNLGLAYWMQDRTTEAVEILLRGLKGRQAAFGLDDRVSFITGRYYHALGNVMTSLNCHDQSLDYHRKALFHYKATLGNGHHRTADLFYKVAEHSMRMKLDDNALGLLDHALKVYGDQDSGVSAVYIPEKARATFKHSQLLRRMQKGDEANEELEEAFELLEQVTGASEDRDPEDLTDDDFNEIVAFWSK